jgi:hypothetical protein
MKKVLMTMMMALAAMTATAGGFRIDRNCTLSGNLFAVIKGDDIKPENAISYGEKAKWFIENHRIGEENYISFWIDKGDGMKCELQTWKENGAVVTLILNDEDKSQSPNYTISDDMFNYLVMIQVEPKLYLIQLHTELIGR